MPHSKKQSMVITTSGKRPIQEVAKELKDAGFEVEQVLEIGGVQRIMLDNFSPQQIRQALLIINGTYETEASGGINYDNIEAYAATGVDFISSGAIIHQATSLDLSLKAEIIQ